MYKLDSRHLQEGTPTPFFTILCRSTCSRVRITAEQTVVRTQATFYFHLRRIAQIKHCLSPPAAESLIHAFISSRLDYCNSLLTGITSHSLHRLQLVQNSAARLLTHTRSREHITPILHSLNWLPINIIFKTLLLTFKALHHLPPPPTCLTSSSPTAPPIKTFGDRAFSHTAPRLWNSLPQPVRDSPSLLTFKSRLKTFLFSQAYNLPYP
ncbi:hypothetical protein N1851_022732 [Merluccius polli]|uniref:Uncharacterized protein n=1 Tax=Merluccius polli TaxID=89951 RepID=A0AA47MHM2_MERPO|nr:hypothetical protein N1851_022732 [Merluccius polli]